MNTQSFPMDAAPLLPHAGFMCCIDRLLFSSPTEAVAEVVLHPGHGLLDGEALSPAGYVELTAQAAGAMQGYDRQRQQLPPLSAYLVGVQDFAIHEAARVGDRLELDVRIQAELGEFTVLTVEARRNAVVLASGRLKVYAPGN